MVCRELNIFSRKEISQSQYDSPDSQLCQSTKTSKATCHNISFPAVENSETKTHSDKCDRLIIVSDSINQDGDAANNFRFQLNPNKTSKKYLDCPCKSKQPSSKPENVKRLKRSRETIFRAQNPHFPRSSKQRIRQRKSKPPSWERKGTSKKMRTKMGKSQTKQKVHFITEVLAFGHILTSNFNLLPNMLPFHCRFLLNNQG